MTTSATQDTLRVSATGHGPNYLPEYWARERGLFEQVGLNVPYRACDPWTGVLDDLASGAADVVLGGLWVPAMYAGSRRPYLAIGQLNARFPKVVLTRDPVTDFVWEQLSGQVVLVPGAGGTAPYEFPAGLIRESGATLSGTRFIRDLSGEMLSELWRDGLGDAYMTDLFSGLKHVHAGDAHIAYRMAEPAGIMPNSVYYVLPERLEELRGRLTRFMTAIGTAMARLSESDDLDDAVALAESHWPSAPRPAVEQAVREMAANGTWSSPAVDAGGSARWIRILDEAGLLLGDVAPDDIWDGSICAAAGE